MTGAKEQNPCFFREICGILEVGFSGLVDKRCRWVWKWRECIEERCIVPGAHFSMCLEPMRTLWEKRRWERRGILLLSGVVRCFQGFMADKRREMDERMRRGKEGKERTKNWEGMRGFGLKVGFMNYISHTNSGHSLNTVPESPGDFNHLWWGALNEKSQPSIVGPTTIGWRFATIQKHSPDFEHFGKSVDLRISHCRWFLLHGACQCVFLRKVKTCM